MRRGLADIQLEVRGGDIIVDLPGTNYTVTYRRSARQGLAHSNSTAGCGKRFQLRPEIHWQKADGDVVMTYKTYHGTNLGNFLGVPGTGRKVSFETVDAMRVVDGRITEHWGVANLYSVMQQLGVLAPLP